MSRQIDVSNPEALSDEDRNYLLERGRLGAVQILDYAARIQAQAAAQAGVGVVEEIPEMEEAEPYSKWLVDELRDECRARHLSDEGKKEQLVARLEANDQDSD